MSNTFEIITCVVAIAFPLFALLDLHRRRGDFNFNLLVCTFAVVFNSFFRNGPLLFNRNKEAAIIDKD